MGVKRAHCEIFTWCFGRDGKTKRRINKSRSTFLNPTVCYTIYIEVERDGMLAQTARKRTLSALICLYIYILIYIYIYIYIKIFTYILVYNMHILQMICMSGAFRGTTAATAACFFPAGCGFFEREHIAVSSSPCMRARDASIRAAHSRFEQSMHDHMPASRQEQRRPLRTSRSCRSG